MANSLRIRFNYLIEEALKRTTPERDGAERRALSISMDGVVPHCARIKPTSFPRTRLHTCADHKVPHKRCFKAQIILTDRLTRYRTASAGGSNHAKPNLSYH